MSTAFTKSKANFGTAPVFLTAISTILGAIMFLRFGYAVGHVGFMGTLAIIALGHLVTIPTAMAIAEIATNQRVEGGGVYYIISRSFGINIGAAIGLALFLSQAISVAFYIIAFGEAFEPVILWLQNSYDIVIPDKRMITLPMLALVALLMLTRGADLGVKALYVVVATLFLSLVFFFMGQGEGNGMTSFPVNEHVNQPDNFFYVFAIIFPAFTGMAAGVGLSGDLRDPKRSIPRGTLWATVAGMVVYVLIAFKLTLSAAPEDLANDQLIMARIALWGPIIPIGLAAATISSALGSILVAPRTLQALANDRIFSGARLNDLMAKENRKGEPINSTIISLLIALVFTLLGDVNAVAEVISMFFMVTYGAICIISFFQHFSADPAYRPAFRSRWYISLLGAVLCIYLMFRMNAGYAAASIGIMVVTYFIIARYTPHSQGLARIFQGVIFQLSRRLQVFIQKTEKDDEEHWRPSVICISDTSFQRTAAFDMMRWMAHRSGFGTYLHFIKGFVSRETNEASREVLKRLIQMGESSGSNVYVHTIISPSYTTAVAQSIQIPGVSGKSNNTFLFEYSRNKPEELATILENMTLVRASDFDTVVLASSERGFGYRKVIHIWLTQNDYQNANLMILLAYVILGHPDWKGGQINIFAIFPEADMVKERANLENRIREGRLPISPGNIRLIAREEDMRKRDIIREHSATADLVIVGFRNEIVKQRGADAFEGYDHLPNLLWVSAAREKEIE